MQVIIPLAGKGTRLRPHTHLVPKPLLKVAGRPVMDWVMDRLDGLDVSELIFITGHLKEQVEAYARARYKIPSRFIEQKVQDGTAGAVNLARPHVREPVLIIFVDTVFEADLTLINRTDADGIIWAKEVEDYQRFGVVVTDEQGLHDADRREARPRRSPSSPTSGSTTSGRWTACGRGSTTCSRSPRTRASIFLTDAFQWMIEHGKRILTAEVGGWYDCGALGHAARDQRDAAPEGRRAAGGFPAASPSTIRSTSRTASPIERSEIGPNVSLERGTRVTDSTVRNAIVGRDAVLTRSTLDGALLGNHVVRGGLPRQRAHWAIIQR